MKTTIKSMKLENFKGVKNKEYVFSGKNINVLGRNGIGKTTIATAFYWVFADKDYDLHSNPHIRTVGQEDIEPKITVVMDIDGKEIEIAKRQIRNVKKSKINVNETVSYKNVYEINSIEYGEKSFREKLSDYGIDLSLMLPLSHPEVFTGQKSDDMRKVLFSMADNIVDDLSIAKNNPGMKRLEKLFKSYTVDEISAKCTSVIKTYHSKYGKNGELLEAEIRGIESQKVDVDVAELELAKNALTKELNENIAKQNDLGAQLSDYDAASVYLMELKFEQGELKKKCHEHTLEKSMEAEKKVSLLRSELFQIEENMATTKSSKKHLEESLPSLMEEIEDCRVEWKRVNELKFDESTLICPMCKQEFSEEKKQEMIAHFYETKRKQLENLETMGNSLRSHIDAKKESIKKCDDSIANFEKRHFEVSKKYAEAKAEHVLALKPVNVEEMDEWKQLEDKIKDTETHLRGYKSFNDIQAELKNEEAEIRLKINSVLIELSKADLNVSIDEKIDKLRDFFKTDSQRALDAESILEQIKMLKEKKREMLTDSINKNFDLVDFEMFKVQNNGEIKECCIPSLKGKKLGEATNTGLELLMKLDIIKGLQKFYKVNFPVFVDGAECFDSTSKENVNMDCQIIFLTVSDDKDLKILEV